MEEENKTLYKASYERIFWGRKARKKADELCNIVSGFVDNIFLWQPELIKEIRAYSFDNPLVPFYAGVAFEVDYTGDLFNVDTDYIDGLAHICQLSHTGTYDVERGILARRGEE